MPPEVTQLSPEQHAWVAEHVWPAFAHTDDTQVPVVAPPGIEQARPLQQSLDAVQV